MESRQLHKENTEVVNNEEDDAQGHAVQILGAHRQHLQQLIRATKSAVKSVFEQDVKEEKCKQEST